MPKLTNDRTDFSWTFAAFGAVGLSGLVINQVVATQFGVTSLGRYNMLLAVVIIGGQVGAMGIHSSVLFHTPKARSEGNPTSEVICSGVFATVLTSAVVSSSIYVGGEIILRSTNNFYYLDGLRAITIGLFLFPINKTLLAHLNGLQRIPIFSILFSGRFILLAATAVAVTYNFDNDQLLPWTITAAEGVIFVGLVFANQSEIKGLIHWRKMRGMFKRHLRYGFKGFLGTTLLDLNTRLDIILLGLISGSRSVGIYSIASLFAEGLYQAAAVPRYNFDPVVTNLFVQNKLGELQDVIKLAKRKIYLFAVPIVALCNLLYPIIVKILFSKELANESWPVFLILSLGVGISAGYIPFTNLLQQSGFPGHQSILLVGMTITNLSLNIVLIPIFGIKGAALATAISWISLIFYLRRLSNPILGFKV